MYITTASTLEIRKRPKEPSKISIKRGTVIKTVGPPVTYKREVWMHVQTVDTPVIDGYVLHKYTNKL